jgi:pimeloyl-ACP methyl ester carboxylesterase
MTTNAAPPSPETPSFSLVRLGGSTLSLLTLRSGFWEQSRGHRLTRKVVFGGYFYLGIVLVLTALENWFLFHPVTAAREWWPPPAGLHTEDLQLASADGATIHAWWCPPAGWQPQQGAMIYFHGNAGNLSHRGEAVKRWQEQLKVAVLIFDYPGFGRSSGRPTEAGCYAAADAAYDWLVGNAHVRPEDVLLYGGSLGGAIATDLAVRRPNRALILMCTFTSFPDMAQKKLPWLPARWLVNNQLDNLRKIGKVSTPVFIAHGAADALIPIQQAERLFAAAPQPKRYFPIEGFGHDEGVPMGFYEVLRQFLRETQTN